MDRNTLNEIRNMIQQKHGTIQATVRATQSLRSGHPAVRVPASIYDGGDGTARNDVASVIDPSDIQFEFDDGVNRGVSLFRDSVADRSPWGSALAELSGPLHAKNRKPLEAGASADAMLRADGSKALRLFRPGDWPQHLTDGGLTRSHLEPPCLAQKRLSTDLRGNGNKSKPRDRAPNIMHVFRAVVPVGVQSSQCFGS